MTTTLSAQIAELQAALPKLGQKDKEFAADLISYFTKKKTLSARQEPWVGKLIERANTPKPEVQKVAVGSFAGVVALFNKSKEKLKFPKIVLQVQGLPVILSQAGPKSKAPGSINVMGEGQYPNRPWYGRVSAEGEWSPSFSMTPEFQNALQELLIKFGQNPARVAKEYGKLTGNCCFCNAKLENEKSVAAGFGPICAENYGLKEEWKNAVKKAALEAEQGVDITVSAVEKTPVLMDFAPTEEKVFKAFLPNTEAVEEVLAEGTPEPKCFLCEIGPAEVEKNGYKICTSCADELEM